MNMLANPKGSVGRWNLYFWSEATKMMARKVHVCI